MSRREFIRFATLLGVAAGSAYAMAGVAAPATAGGSLPFPADDPAAKRGGRLRVGQMVTRMVDPATYSWNEMANQTRPILEYLTMVGPDNVVRPMLIESWQPSSDLRTWTLHVRNGVMWHNGEELTAEHVAWNIRPLGRPEARLFESGLVDIRRPDTDHRREGFAGQAGAQASDDAAASVADARERR